MFEESTQLQEAPRRMAPSVPATAPSIVPPKPATVLDSILRDAATRPQQLVDSWEVPGGAE